MRPQCFLKQRTVLLCAALLLMGADAASTPAAELTAGVSRIDLTPPESMKSPLGGYGARMSRPAEGVHDRIFAKALVVSDGDKRFCVVTADMLGFAPPVKPAVLERLSGEGWSAEQIMLLPSHSHTSIEMNAINPSNVFKLPQIGIHNPELYEFTIDNLVRVIREAADELVPVTVGTLNTELEGWNRNRRIRGGTVDPELTVTRIDSADGKPLAVLINWTAHPTFMSHREMLFSGGWPGHLQRTLESLIGEGVTVMYYNGAEGNQSPIPRPDSGPSRWERAEIYGRELAVICWKLWQQTPTDRSVAFEFSRHEIALPERTFHPRFRETGGLEYGLTEFLLKQMLPRMFPEKTASVSLRLGELLIVGVPGEMGAELGLELKARSRDATAARHPVIGGLADEWISYIITEDQYELGQYEASVSFYGPKLGRTIVDGAIAGVRKLPAPGR